MPSTPDLRGDCELPASGTDRLYAWVSKSTLEVFASWHA
jgi:hypothetical protein